MISKCQNVEMCSGYMSPEYAMQGQFSEKSDVFSFAVLLLEIVSGRRNTSLYHDEYSLTLLGYVSPLNSLSSILTDNGIKLYLAVHSGGNVLHFQAWKLWNENNIVNLIDPVISDPCFELEMLRCINVGLLCVQEFVKDRPSMSTVTSMLSSEIVDLPSPKQPAFTERPNAFDTESSQQSQKNCSVNNVTVTVIEGR